MKKMNKKGFTLAELLIVVAIIAVLTAIAIPLFVGALDRAQEARDNANIRAVRGAAAVYLLEKSGDPNVWTPAAAKGDENNDPFGWDVTATINALGEITSMKVKPCKEASSVTEGCVASGDNFTVTLHLKSTDIEDITSAT